MQAGILIDHDCTPEAVRAIDTGSTGSYACMRAGMLIDHVHSRRCVPSTQVDRPRLYTHPRRYVPSTQAAQSAMHAGGHVDRPCTPKVARAIDNRF